MKRGLLVSLSVLALGWLAGCGSGSSGGGGGTPPQANSLKGQYAFVLAGFDSTGNPVGIAGSITADGFGHITAGEVDVNDNGTAATTSGAVTGTYAFDKTGSGNDTTLGGIALANTVGTVATHSLAFAFSLQASGGFGQIMSLDDNGFAATGTIQQQSSSAFTLSGLAGDFVVSLNGRNSSNPTSVLGRLTLSSGGAGSNVAFDRSEAGTLTGSASATGGTVSFAGAGPDANGRSTFTLGITDTFGTTNQTFAYYAISAKRIVAVETDASGTMTADFASQTIPATPTTTGSVFGMAGVDTAPAINDEISAVGQLQMTGVGATAGTLNWDANDAASDGSGPVFTLQPSTLDPVAYDTNTGRGTVTVSGGNAHGLGDTLIFYLSGPGSGFILDATAGANNRAMAGPLTAQASGSFSAATDLNGLGIVRARGSSVNDLFSLVGLLGPSTGASPFTVLFDVRQAGAADATDQTTGFSLGSIDPNVGRGTFTFTGGTSTNAFYVIGPNQFVFIDITQSDAASPVFFVNPD